MILDKPEMIKELLAKSKTIAVVGMSPNPERDSNKVGKYLIDTGYNVIPINPTVPEIYGKRTYASILDIPKDVKVDIVDIFRNPEASKEVVLQAPSLHPKAVWLQLGAESPEVIKAALSENLDVVYGICIMVTHQKVSNEGFISI
ncbi:MAG: CoA-binding protein [Thermoplasmatales archaeon]